MKLSEGQRRRAVDHVLRKMGELGWDRGQLIVEAHADPATIRSFLQGDTWPQTGTRQRIEAALGLSAGTLEYVALRQVDVEEEGDQVELAIKRSALSRANQHTLIGKYYEMLEAQERRGTA